MEASLLVASIAEVKEEHRNSRLFFGWRWGDSNSAEVLQEVVGC